MQQALTRYNTTNAIKPVSPTGMLTYAISCASPGGTTGAPTTLGTISGFTAVAPPATKAGAAPPAAQMLYALSGGTLYQISTDIDATGAPATGATCYPLAIAGTTGVLAIAADGSTLYALVSLIGGAAQVVEVQPAGTNADGSPKIATTPMVNVVVAAGQTPSVLAVPASIYRFRRALLFHHSVDRSTARR